MPDSSTSPRKALLYEALIAGSCASLLSTLALAWAGHRELRSAVAPVNAVSHWRWGRPALRQRAVTRRHTLLGYAIHHGASIWWAALHAAAMQRHRLHHEPAAVLASAAVTSAIACVVDFKCTPERFTPGFEHHLSHRSVAGVYALFAVGLALGALAVRGRHAAQGEPSD
ncbi:hypothetical protein [Comamonas endophytica]|uniref:DUF2938 family protein n=1 Tax=Comamonas endophytica TaxID=2949090 RepID=A0ABY6GC52_9BURK|nr:MULTISPECIES: hypothetical protein [unclassified Acidovorax]MCD2512998.1 hypothetical protein [Acidovorax sp. D4N7]UYG52661.1 hypothetical protein M9799_05310 [Acidovorax sp. 5MLIR]